MAVPSGEREAILKVIETWPAEDRVRLAQTILQQATQSAALAQRVSWREMAGLASNGQPPPADEEVAQWLDERRAKKYG